MFFYLNKNEAKKGISLTIATSGIKINDFIKLYGDDVVEYEAASIPQFITYNEESNTIREATELEKLSRGQLVLEENQVIINNQIITYDLNFQKVVDGKVVNKTLKELVETNILTIEEVKTKKIEELKSKRDEFINSDLELDGYFIQVRNQEDRDKFNRILLGLLLGKLKKEDKEEWRLSDNSYRNFTYSKLAEVPELYSNRERESFKKFHQLEDKIKNSNTIEEIESIKWD